MGNIRIQVCSDSSYERLIAEIYVDERFIALVSQENGPDDLQVDFPRDLSREGPDVVRVSHDDLVEGLRRAKAELCQHMEKRCQ